MALYTIGDLHLSLSAKKPMDVFGGAWVGYMDKLREGLSVLTEDQALGVDDGQESLTCCSPRGLKEPDKTERLN